ncbi:MAG: GMC family oxidoreductase N-terminal domain-containing protein [Nitrososphaerales archaeon]
MMKNYDFIVVGSGAGGGTIAKELSLRGKRVALLEAGGWIKPGKALKHYVIEQFGGVEAWWVKGVGGATEVALGNGVRALSNRFSLLGLNLEEEFREAETEMGITLTPSSFHGEGTKRILDAASKIGYNFTPMPKFIDFERCSNCGLCTIGCPYAAKWSASKEVSEAKKLGAKIITRANVTKIIIHNGKADGVIYRSDNTLHEVYASNVILCSGAISTPRLLQGIGLSEAGEGLFLDVFITVGGVLKGIKLNKELPMQVYLAMDKFILSPHYSMFLLPYLESKGFRVSKENVLGLMVKIADEPAGMVKTSSVEKHLTKKDMNLLLRGKKIAEEILLTAGADPESIIATFPRGFHPGGTAAMGKVTNKNFETEFNGLFVCDASLLPEAPGAPPILTIVALAKRLAKMLV